MKPYAKVIVLGSPITKSNFKLHNALYEEEIAYYARSQNPDLILEESLIAVLKVYYKSEKRHPDTANITKSIFDGIEKSGLIVNDAQIRKIIVEEFYDKLNPRFELELSYSITENEIQNEKRLYSSLKKSIRSTDELNKKTKTPKSPKEEKIDSSIYKCSICKNILKENNYITADKGKTLICKNCFNKLL